MRLQTIESRLGGRTANALGLATRQLKVFDLLTPRWAYVFRSVTAAALAYWVAYTLQMDKPYSAASTVMLVANMNQGAVLAKGRWRLAGTVVGGIAAIIVMGLFIQAPALFLIFFGLWLGICSGAATLIRGFRSTGPAVAGYTLGFATYGALEVPENALSIVLGRVASVAVGVVCLGLVTAIFSRRAARGKLEGAITRQLTMIGRLVLDRVENNPERVQDVGATHIADMFAIEDLLELSRAESTDVAVRVGAVREGLAGMFAALLGARELAFASVARDPSFLKARELVGAHLPAAIGRIETGDRAGLQAALAEIRGLHLSLHQIIAELEVAHDRADVIIALDQLLEVIEDWESGIAGLLGLNGVHAHPTRGFHFHRDWTAAVENGVRALLSIVIAGGIGIGVGLQQWPLMLALLAPYSILMAMTGDPVGGAWSVVRGTLVALPAAFICVFLLLPSVNGFPLLIASMLPFWLAGFYATTVPRYVFDGMGFLVAFNTLVYAQNQMLFDGAFFLNEALGWMVAVIATLLVLKLILPFNPVARAHRYETAFRRAVTMAIRKGWTGRRHAWEHLQHHRLVNIAVSLKARPSVAAAVLTEALGALHYGRTALRLRAALQDDRVSERALHFGNAALDAAALDDPATSLTLDSLFEATQQSDHQGGEDQAITHRVAACIRNLSILKQAHGAWIAGTRKIA